MSVFRETSAAEKRRELEAVMAQLEQEELKEWKDRESTIGKIFGDAIRSGKLSGDAFLQIITPLITRKGDWKKLGIVAVSEVTEYTVRTAEVGNQADVHLDSQMTQAQEVSSAHLTSE